MEVKISLCSSTASQQITTADRNWTCYPNMYCLIYFRPPNSCHQFCGNISPTASPENKSQPLCMLILPVTNLNPITKGVRCVRQPQVPAKTLHAPCGGNNRVKCNLPFNWDPLLTGGGKIILCERVFSSITTIQRNQTCTICGSFSSCAYEVDIGGRRCVWVAAFSKHHSAINVRRSIF